MALSCIKQTVPDYRYLPHISSDLCLCNWSFWSKTYNIHEAAALIGVLCTSKTTTFEKSSRAQVQSACR